MDFDQNNNFSQPPVTSVPEPPSPAAPKAKRPRTGWKILAGIVVGLSILGNIVLILMVVGLFMLFTAGQEDVFVEQVVRPGPRTEKIAIISLDGIIDDRQARDVYKQLRTASKDPHIKGLIIRIDSPGGTIAASDEIYNELLNYRHDQKRPVVAFMRGIAASGGYYSSVACEKIIAEPTTITGSIGVIMGYLVVQNLLEDKLGIQPVIVKSGEKKDWPSSFHPPTDEQLKYLQDKVITPAYGRFVQIVADGRAGLNLADVKRLADGSIFAAAEARDEKLIDDIGYLDKAIDTVSSLAGIEKAQVIEYRKPFSFTELFGSYGKSILRINRTSLFEMAVPQVMYLCTVNQ